MHLKITNRQSALEAGQSQTYVLLMTWTAWQAREAELTNLVERLDETSTAYGMQISAEKTKLMTNNTNSISSNIRVNDEKLETVQSFKYLEAIVTEEGPMPENTLQDSPDHRSTHKAQDHLGRQEHRPQLKDHTVALPGHVHVFIFL